MLTRVNSVASFGLETLEVGVEVNVASKSFPAFSIVGLPSKAIEEAKERVRTAILNSNIEFPQKRITVNLAPADLPKEGSCYDLPIALGIIRCLVAFQIPQKSIFFGELSLDGSLRHTKGVLLAALFAADKGFKNLFVPCESANEAAVVEDIKVFPVKNLTQVLAHLEGEKLIKPCSYQSKGDKTIQVEFDLCDILGQEQAKRALEIAAAGGHNLFLEGPPGAGKTMLSRALPGILPPLTKSESLEVTKIYSIAGKISAGGSLIKTRPFRTPHHNISQVGLIGGGSKPMPGEISLAHRGILFLDEVAEFGRTSLEALRQPLEDGQVAISRAAGRVVFPSRFILSAAANPCPCGYLTHPKKECRCSPQEVLRYKKKLSGPLLDRIDLYIDVPAVETEKLSSLDKKDLEKSRQVRSRIIKARQRQTKRFLGEKINCNAEMSNKEIKRFCKLDTKEENLLKKAVDQFQLSARAYFRLIKVARTIADLANSENIELNHLAEALQYRAK